MAAVSNLAIDQGTTFTVTITVTDDTGSARNLTNYFARSQMRKSYGSSTSYTFTASVYDAATGKVRLQLTSTQTSAIPAGRYLYDIEITNTSTTAKTRILEGIVIVTPEITQT